MSMEEIRRQQTAVMRGGDPDRQNASWFESGWKGLLNGMFYNALDEAGRAGGGGDAWLTDAYEADPTAYSVGSILGTAFSPLTIIAGRIPLGNRHGGLVEALAEVDRRGLDESLSTLTRRNAERSGGLAAILTGRNRRDWQADLGNATDAELLQQTINRRRGTQELADELSFAHGALSGLGGVTPGEMDIEDRLAQAALGGVVGFGATRGAADFNDLARGPVPFLTRASDRRVVDLGGVPTYNNVLDRLMGREAPIPPQALGRLMDQMAGSEEASYRAANAVGDAGRMSRNGQPIVTYGRAANVVTPRGEANPQVAPISDPLSLTQSLIARAAQSPEAAPVLRRLSDQADVDGAMALGVGASRSPGGVPPNPNPTALPDYMREDFADALLRDPPGRRFLRELVSGQRGWQRTPNGQAASLSPADRADLRALVLRRLEEEGSRINETGDAAAARRLLALAEDPDVRALFSDRALGLRLGQPMPETERLRTTLARVADLAGRPSGMSDALRSLAAPDEGAQDFALMLNRGQGLSRRLTQAILDPAFLETPRRRWAVDPNDRLQPGVLRERAERGVTPYGRRATPGVPTEVAGALLAAGADRALHYGVLSRDDERSR
jgi:hypothetical protein